MAHSHKLTIWRIETYMKNSMDIVKNKITSNGYLIVVYARDDFDLGLLRKD